MDVAKDVLVENIDANSSIALPVTALSQIAAESDGTIWASCRNTGLYRIERASGAVTGITRISGGGLTALNDAACYGVAVKEDTDDIWAIFEDTLAQSTDGGDTWSLFNEGTDPQYLSSGYSAPGEYSNLNGIWVAPSDPSDIVFLGAPDAINLESPNGGRLIGWSRAESSPTSNADSLSNANADSLAFPAALHLSHPISNGRLVTKQIRRVDDVYIFTFDKTIGDLTASLYNDNNESGVDNSLVVIKGPTGEDLIVGDNDPNTFRARTEAQLDTPSFEIDLGPGIATGNNQSIQDSIHVASLMAIFPGGIGLFWSDQDTGILSTAVIGAYVASLGLHDDRRAGNYEYAIWEDYGWDGTDWVLGNPNSKPTHTAQEDLIEGVTIGFNDGGAAPHFVNNEHYLFGLFDGLWKDDATSFDFDILVPYTQSETGTDFTPNVVPLVDTGLVSNQLESFTDFNTAGRVYTEPGSAGAAVEGNAAALGESQMEGDIEVTFGIDPIRDDTALTTEQSSFGIGIGTFPFASAPLAFNISSIENGISFKQLLSTDDLTYIIWESGSEVFEATIPNATFDRSSDRFSIRRVGTTVDYLYNGTVLYTSLVSSTGAKQSIFSCPSTVNGTCYDIRASFTANRRQAVIGDGVSTGQANINFRHLPKPLAQDHMEILLDGVPAALVTDTSVSPAVGEVQLHKSGNLIFNPADEGKAITGNWLAFHKLNLV